MTVPEIVPPGSSAVCARPADASQRPMAAIENPVSNIAFTQFFITHPRPVTWTTAEDRIAADLNLSRTFIKFVYQACRGVNRNSGCPKEEGSSWLSRSGAGEIDFG